MSAKPSKLALGFDAAAQRTDCVVLDDQGKVMGRGAAGPSDPLRTGFDAAFREWPSSGTGMAGAQLRPGRYIPYARDWRARGSEASFARLCCFWHMSFQRPLRM